MPRLFVGVISWWFAPQIAPSPLTGIGLDPDGPAELLAQGQFETSLYPLFELARILRSYFTFWVVVNFARSHGESLKLSLALALPVLWILGRALVETFVFGAKPAEAGLINPNSMATYVLMLGGCLVPGVLRSGKGRVRLVFGLGTLACVVSVILSGSRSAWAILCVFPAYFAWILWASRIRSSPRWLLSGVVALIAVLLLSALALEHLRTTSSWGARVFLLDQAKTMTVEHPFGVGLGNFAAASWKSTEAMCARQEAYVPVHNIWYLTSAELGIPGALVLLAIWVQTARLIWDKRQHLSESG